MCDAVPDHEPGDRAQRGRLGGGRSGAAAVARFDTWVWRRFGGVRGFAPLGLRPIHPRIFRERKPNYPRNKAFFRLQPDMSDLQVAHQIGKALPFGETGV